MLLLKNQKIVFKHATGCKELRKIITLNNFLTPNNLVHEYPIWLAIFFTSKWALDQVHERKEKDERCIWSSTQFLVLSFPEIFFSDKMARWFTARNRTWDLPRRFTTGRAVHYTTEPPLALASLATVVRSVALHALRLTWCHSMNQSEGSWKRTQIYAWNRKFWHFLGFYWPLPAYPLLH